MSTAERATARRALPDRIMIGNECVTFTELYRPFYESDYADMLDGRPRWGDFTVSDAATHIKLLGVDADNLLHLRLSSRGLMPVYIVDCIQPPEFWGGKPVPDLARLSPHDIELLLIASDIHDVGESTKGDTANPGKSEMSEQEEFIELLRIENEVTRPTHGAFGTFFDRTLEHAVKRFMPEGSSDFEGFVDFYRKEYIRMHGQNEPFGVMFEAIDEVLLKPESKLGKFFTIFEKAGYLRTALRAWHTQEDPSRGDMTPESRHALQGLGFSVLCNKFTMLIEAAGTYPPILRQFVENAGTITQMYQTPPPEAAAHLFRYQQYKSLEAYTESFASNGRAWVQFVDRNRDIIDPAVVRILFPESV